MMKTLPVMERFYTLQGEGAYQGQAAYFIRLGGCDVGCVWCDVKESWDVTKHPSVAIDSIVSDASKHGCKLAVVTGGEPLMHNCDSLTTALKDNGFNVNIETSGTHPLTGEWDWICFSPKKFKKPLPEFYQTANELKVVVYHRSDLKWAEEHRSQMHQDCIFYLQPEWSVRDKVTPWIIDYIKDNPSWRLSLQSHKYVNIP
ncbi:MAG: 7-carboxy-7-deazaguanine synthase QueE [Bacteroidota bacterium]